MNHLHPVPDARPPAMIDPPGDGRLDDWEAGWSAAVTRYAPEVAAAYERGLRARRVEPPRFNLDPLAWCAAFVAGFLVAIVLVS